MLAKLSLINSYQPTLSIPGYPTGTVSARTDSFNFTLLTLPISVCGNAATISTDFGTLYAASCSLQNCINASPLTNDPSFKTTIAFTASPHCGSGTPITAASTTSGCL